MSSNKRPVAFVVGIGCVTLVGWIGVATAKSHALAQTEFAGDCGARVKELESEVRVLREQLRVMTERQNVLPSSGIANAPSKSEHGNRTDRGAREFSNRGASATCDPPFGIDREGNKYYFAECLEPKAPDSCSAPNSQDKSGTKLYKRGCLKEKPTLVTCEPPYQFDADGFKSYKPECL